MYSATLLLTLASNQLGEPIRGHHVAPGGERKRPVVRCISILSFVFENQPSLEILVHITMSTSLCCFGTQTSSICNNARVHPVEEREGEVWPLVLWPFPLQIGIVPSPMIQPYIKDRPHDDFGVCYNCRTAGAPRCEMQYQHSAL